MVILSVSVLVLGVAGFLVFDEDFVVPRVNWPGLMLMPDTVTVEPLTPVTLPEAMARLARALRKLERPPLHPAEARTRPALGAPAATGAAAAAAEAAAARDLRRRRPAAAPRRPRALHDPDELAVLTVMVRAAIVVLDFFEGVPLTVTQSPLASALTASVTVLENVVDVLQFTVVCPELAFWTSMLDAAEGGHAARGPDGGVGRRGGRSRCRGHGGGGEQRRGARAGEAHEAPTVAAPAGQ